MKDYLCYRFTCNPRQPLSDALISTLADLNFEAFEDTAKGFAAFLPASKGDGNLRMQVEQAVKDFAALGQATFEIGLVPGENWNATWEREYPEVRVGDHILVRAPFHAPDGEVETEVVITPQMSFGTGHHATTWLMLNFLKDMDVSQLQVLDMGCGTGVLAIAAMLRNAKGALAIDIEQNAVDNTLENAQLNAVDILVEKGDARQIGGRRFQLIFANINRNVLCMDMETFAQSLDNGGVLLLSGFFESDIPLISAAAEGCGLVFAEKRNKEEWTALKYSKAPL